MAKWKINYFKERCFSPISYWVHIGDNHEDEHYFDAETFTPPFPRHVSQGYPQVTLSVLSFDFIFYSALEMTHCMEVLGQKLLPTTIALSHQRVGAVGPNQHWLSRLPAKLKPWSKRQQLVKAIKQAMQAIKKEGLIF
jgi:hypothetical protein